MIPTSSLSPVSVLPPVPAAPKKGKPKVKKLKSLKGKPLLKRVMNPVVGLDLVRTKMVGEIEVAEAVELFLKNIGQALADIQAGAWVHVHNCRSEHFGFHREQYGLKA